MRTALIIFPVKGGFVLVEETREDVIKIDDLKQVVPNNYAHQLTDAVSDWRSDYLSRNTPPETP